MNVQPAGRRVYTLGEGPHWDERSATLILVDSLRGQIVSYDPESRIEAEVARLDDTVGNAIPYADDNRKLVVCTGRGIYKLDLDTKQKTLLAEIGDGESPVPTRINDGKCDAVGRLWTGTMPAKVEVDDLEVMVRGKNNLWSFAEGELKHKFHNVTLSNGITWTTDNRTMFYNDTVPGTTYAFDFDLASGEVANRRVLVDFSANPAYQDLRLPDGMTIDATDKIWLACCLSGAVVQIDPETAKVLTRITFPTKYITSCCFGGRNYDTLYVTSASFPQDATNPEDGLLYQVTELGVKGRAAFEFGG